VAFVLVLDFSLRDGRLTRSFVFGSFLFTHPHMIVTFFRGGHLDLDWPVAVGANRLFVLKAIKREWLLVLLALQALHLDHFVATLPLDHHVSLALRVLQVLHLAGQAQEHRVAGEALELSTFLRVD